MVWKYTKGDKYSVEQLIEFYKIFILDLESARHEFAKVAVLQLVPGYEWMLKKTREGVEEAHKNVIICLDALYDAYKRKG